MDASYTAAVTIPSYFGLERSLKIGWVVGHHCLKSLKLLKTGQIG
jgi:hypothetical protein